MRWILLLAGVQLACANGSESDEEVMSGTGAEVQQQCIAQARRLPDSVVAPSGDFVIRVAVVEAGRNLVEVRTTAEGSLVASLTAGILDIRWLPEAAAIVYAVSPIYDDPGVFMMEIPSGEVVTLVEPQIRDAAYPGGADYLRVCAVERDETDVVIHVGHFGHVNEIDFTGSPRPRIETVRLPLEARDQ